jgi:peptidoglycan/xylan/chitin deacetylase (PgdA/CDA1 family)
VRHPHIARAALAAGHRLGNHTQHHRSAWNTPRAEYLAGVAECAALLAEYAGAWVGGDEVDKEKDIKRALSGPIRTPLAAYPRALPLFRPPYGRLTWPVLRRLRPHYRVIMWSLLTRDYDPGLAPERALRLTLAATRPGDIVVLHDSRKASRSLRFLLPRLLTHYGALGYEFAAL